MLLMQHTCHLYCRSKSLASTCMLASHRASYEHLAGAALPQTRVSWPDGRTTQATCCEASALRRSTARWPQPMSCSMRNAASKSWRAYLESHHEARQARMLERIERHRLQRERVLARFDLVAERSALLR